MHEDIQTYNATQPAGVREICEALATAIDTGLEGAKLRDGDADAKGFHFSGQRFAERLQRPLARVVEPHHRHRSDSSHGRDLNEPAVELLGETEYSATDYFRNEASHVSFYAAAAILFEVPPTCAR